MALGSQRRPAFVLPAIGAMSRDEGDGGRQPAMGERDAGRGSAAQGGGDARDDGDRQAGAAQRLDLLATAPEHERIAGLQAHHGLAGTHAAHQLGVDFGLGPAHPAVALADGDELGVTARARQDGRRHQVVVQDGIGLLQELRGAQGQEIGITRAGADDVGDAGRRRTTARGVLLATARSIELAQHHAAGAGVIAGQHQLGRRSLDQPAPQGAAVRRLGDQRADLGAKGFGEAGQRAQSLGQDRLEALAQHGRQDGRRAAGRDRDHDVVAIDDRRHDEIAQRRPVDDVHRHRGRPGRARRCRVGIGVAGCNEGSGCTPVRLDVIEPRLQALDLGTG